MKTRGEKEKRIVAIEALSLFMLLCCGTVFGQKLAVKSNLLFDAACIPSGGVEAALGTHVTVQVQGLYNPFSFGERKWKIWSVEPQVRWWPCTAFSGLFAGVGLSVGGFNLGGLPLSYLKGHRIQGTFLGGGAVVGWHRILSPRWGLEVSVGAGALRARYTRYPKGRCTSPLGTYSRVVPYPTGLSVSLVYLIR